MIKSVPRFRRPSRVLVLLLVSGSAPSPTPALADTRAGIDVAVAGKVATNPFDQVDANTGVAGALQADPWLRFLNEQSRVELRGSFRLDQYVRHYGTDTAARAQVQAEHRFSPNIAVTAAAGYLSSRRVLQDSLSPGSTAGDLPPSTTLVPNVALHDEGTRTKALDAQLGLNAKLSRLDEVDIAFAAVDTHYDTAGNLNNDYLSARLIYARQTADHTYATASVTVARSDYQGTRIGDGTIITPQVGARHQFSSTINASASLGVSIARIQQADGSTRSSTTLSGEVRLCKLGSSSSLCLSADRRTQPTAASGVTAVTGATVTFNERISRRDTLSASARYSRNDATALPFGAGDLEFYGVSATLTRDFDRRLAGYVTPSFSRVIDKVTTRKANVQLEAGVRVRIGATQ